MIVTITQLAFLANSGSWAADGPRCSSDLFPRLITKSADRCSLVVCAGANLQQLSSSGASGGDHCHQGGLLASKESQDRSPSATRAVTPGGYCGSRAGKMLLLMLPHNFHYVHDSLPAQHSELFIRKVYPHGK